MTPLVTPEWLEARLGDDCVVPIDARVRRIVHANGPSTWESCQSDWEAERIPGAGYLHFVDDLSDPDDPRPFMIAPPSQIGGALSLFGVSERTTLVVYGSAGEMSAHRVWWVLQVSGCPDVRSLDGGMQRWSNERRRTQSGPARFRQTSYVPTPLSHRIALRSDAVRALEDKQTCLINALSPALFRGEGNQVFGRRGRIPGSINLPSDSLIDPQTGCFLPPAQLAAIVDHAVPRECEHLIPYCGGAVAATTVALVLAVLGKESVAVYDGSLFDWTSDPDAPLETGV